MVREHDLAVNQNKPILIFCHYHLFHFVQDDKQPHVNNYLEIQQLFQSYGNVVTAFHGHVHEERIQQLNGASCKTRDFEYKHCLGAPEGCFLSCSRGFARTSMESTTSTTGNG